MDIGKGTEVFADPLLERVFANLAFNTMKHAPSAKHIKVRSEMSAAGGITIWFEDDGPGIPPESKAVLFEEKLGRRTGHGLHFVRRLLEITGMSIREVGEPGKGARFAIEVPAFGYRLATPEQK
ncbi:MAG: sensor histidine kinase [Methanomassiliicoccales archaeon]